MTEQQLKDYCEAEFENIDTVLSEIFSVIKDVNSDYSTVERAAIAAFLHNFYNGVENILKRILLAKKIEINNTPTWHKDVLTISFEKGIIDDDLFNTLLEYLSFRHFFVHAYSFNLNWVALKPLVENLKDPLKVFKSSIFQYI